MKKRKESRIHGVLYVDKPSGMTSHDVVAQLRRALDMSRIGHAGTLDPDATGLLTILLGKATSLSESLTKADKTYLVCFRLGVETDTFDSTGQEVAIKDPSAISREMLEKMLKNFLGGQKQRPPMFSAVKMNGRKLYELARQGVVVDVPLKEIEVHRLDLLSFSNPEGELEMECTKGTYVRALIHDLGQKLGVGAITTAIRRVRSGEISIDQAVPLAQILNSENPVEWLQGRVAFPKT